MSGFFDFPIITNEIKLPLYLLSVGINEWQYHVIRKEGYPNHQIIYCTEGSGTLIVDGISYTIEPNMGFFLPPGYPHEYYSNGAIWDTHWVIFEGKMTEEVLKFLMFDGFKIFTLPQTKELDKLIVRMHEMIRNDIFYGVHSASGILYSFIIELNRLINIKKKSNSTLSSITIKTIDYINTHCREKITLNQLSDNVGVSDQYLCRLFRNEMNLRPMEYVTKRKIQEAKKLLMNTDMKIDDIAETLSFCSTSYFHRLFKKYEGITAAKYRK